MSNICAECKYLDPDEMNGYKYKCDNFSGVWVYGSESACGSFCEDRYRSQSEIDSLSR